MKPDKDKLIELYWKQGLSMPKAAREIGIGKSTLEYWMKKFGIPRRPLLKYPRAIFEGGFQEKAYLLGLRYGDLYVVPYKKGICIETTTSHPTMAELFWQTFRRYGHIYMHPIVELNSAEGIDRWASGGIRKKNLWRLIVERRLMVKQLLLQLPIRHPEKTSKSAIAVAALEGLPHNEVRKRVLAWRLSIRQEKQAFARLASSQCRFQTRFHEITSR